MQPTSPRTTFAASPERLPASCGHALPAASRRARVAGTVQRARRTARHLASEVGQGTVEYVGLLLLMATLLAAIVAAAGQLGGKDQIGKKVVDNIGASIDKAGDAKR